MLGKLLKYELKASSRTLLPLYAGILILSLVCGLFLATQANNFMASNKMNIFFGILYLLLFALLVAMGVLTVVSIVQRFYKNLLGDEGFLMFTLPVSSITLLSSKLLAAMIWTLASSIVGVLSFILTMFVPVLLVGNIDWNDIFYVLGEAWDSLMAYPSIGTFIFQIFLGCFFSIIVTTLMAYLAMMIGQLQTFTRHQIIVSFISFFLIGWAFSTIYSLLPFNNLMFNFDYLDSLESLTAAFWIPLLESVVQAVILFFGTNWLMRNKLNL